MSTTTLEVDLDRLTEICERYGVAELDELFGRHVDLVSKRVLHRRLRTTILAESRPVYEAA